MTTRMRWAWSLLLAASAAHAAGRAAAWNIERHGSQAIAVNDEMAGLKVPLVADLDGPVILEWKDAPTSKDVGLLVYDAGLKGTHAVYRTERAVLIDKKKRAVIGEETWRIDPEGDAPSISQPLWKWGAHSVKVRHPDTGESSEFSW